MKTPIYITLTLFIFLACQQQQAGSDNEVENQSGFINMHENWIDKKINKRLEYVKGYHEAKQIKIYNELLELAPDNTKVLWGLTDVYMAHYSTHDSALTVLNRLQKLQPDHANIYLNKALIFTWKRATLDSALININKAISLDSEYSRLYYEKAKILQKLELYDEAKATWRKSASTDYNGVAYFYLAKLYESLDQRDSACICLDSAYAYQERNSIHWWKMSEMNKNLKCNNKTKLVDAIGREF